MDSKVVDCDDSDYSLITTDASKSYNVWLMDSTCIYHVCPNRDWFFDLQEGECSVMHTANNNPLTAYGVGSTFIGIVTTTSNDEKEAEMTKLWHMCLGHAGEKSLKILSNQGLLKGVKTCDLEFCEHCFKGNQTTVKFGTSIHNSKGESVEEEVPSQEPQPQFESI
uniref:Uncharacterized protein n=1 Tax=Solanum lycopersicum TaxID=4081 RepID=A0A3Q7IGU6_SOLLC